MTPYMLYVPVSEATTPASGECICNHWWLVHPAKGLAFWVWDEKDAPQGYEPPTPQCATSKRLMETTSKEPSHTVEFFPCVFLAHARRRMKERK